MTKPVTLPPCQIETRGSYRWPEFLQSAWSVVIDVAGKYRGHRSLARYVQNDLMRFCAKHGLPAFCGTCGDDRAPCLYFDKATIDRWLDAGGRPWIIAEMEARAGRRVIAFPGRRA